MKRNILFIALLIFGCKGYAQDTAVTKTIKKDSIICLCCNSTTPLKQVLWVVNGKTVQQLDIAAINPNYIEELTVLKGNDAILKYGNAAKNGVIALTLKKEIKWLSVKKILAKNNIDQGKLKLPIYLNDKLNITGETIFEKAHKKFKVVIVEANLTTRDRLPYNGKYLSINETID